jgi:hypothetical protein
MALYEIGGSLRSRQTADRSERARTMNDYDPIPEVGVLIVVLVVGALLIAAVWS